jgi:galactokinase
MDSLIKEFKLKYNVDKAKIVKSPLRICPLGAHVDHQNGLITGFTIDQSINMIYKSNPDGYIKVQSFDFPDQEYFHVRQVPHPLPGFWGNYLRGAVLSLQRDFIIKNGIDALISGKVAIGGLSSSAAVTTAYLLALCDVNNIHLSSTELIEHSHWIETNFIGLNNGILDQAANILSKNNMLMYLDCQSNEYRLIPKGINMPDFEVIIVYSGISKVLISTDYNNRVDECKISAILMEELSNSHISKFKNVKLRDVNKDTYMKFKDSLPGRFQKRANHFYSENDRVLNGIKSWQDGDIISFGKLVSESGESSINNYECGCEELITIFNTLKNCKGVYGARFSGAGYRGCCIGLIDPIYKKEIENKVHEIYPKKYPKYKDLYKVYFAKPDDGARIIGYINL